MTIAGKTVLITGSTDGIGKQTARVLAQQGARVLIHGRSTEKVNTAVRELQQAYPETEPCGYVADFSSLQAVRDLAEEILTVEPVLHVLINNAGTHAQEFHLTKDGFELTFAVNQLAPFLLTTLLLPRLKESSPARIVNVTSIAHHMRNLDISKINDPSAFTTWNAYKISKFANIATTYQFADRLDKKLVTVNCLHPGTVDTKMLHSLFPDIKGISIADGAKNSIYLASSNEVAEISGAYFEDGKQVESAPETYNKELQLALWKQCGEWVGL